MPRTYPVAERRQLIEQALELRYNERLKWEEIADRINVARSTLAEWRKSTDWKEADTRWRKMLRDQARGDSAQMLDDAVQVIYELMKTDRSGYVRFMAASKIIDMNQVGNELEEQSLDQQKELNDFLLKAHRKAQVEIAPVLPGGLLPASIAEENELYRDRKRAESAAVEAEYREVMDKEV